MPRLLVMAFYTTDMAPKARQSIPEEPNGVIHCACCLNIKGQRVPATSIVAGYSVCDAHYELASRPDFSIFKLIERRSVV